MKSNSDVELETCITSDEFKMLDYCDSCISELHKDRDPRLSLAVILSQAVNQFKDAAIRLQELSVSTKDLYKMIDETRDTCAKKFKDELFATAVKCYISGVSHDDLQDIIEIANKKSVAYPSNCF